MRTCTQLTQEERYQIHAVKKAGYTQKESAEFLGRSPSTISRELSRNRGQRGYRPKQAHKLACSRRKERSKHRIDATTWQWVEEFLWEDWSPKQISGWLMAHAGIAISPNFSPPV